MTHAHTAGPWHQRSNGNGVWEIADADGFHVLKIRGGVTPTSANAALIARAPELLAENEQLREALQAIADSWPAHGSLTDNKMADAMAAKARSALSRTGG